ncbi:MAG TPA: hypothetical protein VEQ87_12745 [Burkholderiales bacterium]|nr:hypothetical protein [Burkholderiales bacterium]
MSAVLSLLLLAVACSTKEYRYVGDRQVLKNDEGHVIGQKEMLRDPETGQQFEEITYFTPRRDEKGTVIGYEEPLPPGYVVRDLQGRRIGVRYTDLRSRGTNPGSGGVTVIVNPPER